MLSEKILDAIITATPSIIEDVVRSILTGYVLRFFQAIKNKGLFVKPNIYISVRDVTCETISSCVGLSKSFAISPSFSIMTLSANEAAYGSWVTMTIV